MGSMMTDLKGVHDAINMAHRKLGNRVVSFEELTVQLFKEVELIWPMLGYPPLVTPFSQYVKNIAVMNLLALAQGKSRFAQIDKDSWSMITGRSGQLPGPLAPEIVELAKQHGEEFYTGDPQAAYPNALPQYIKEMEENGWDRGQDDEELFELAMHDRQYRDYRSGVARQRFEQELATKRAEQGHQMAVEAEKSEGLHLNYLSKEHPNAAPIVASATGRLMWEVNLDDRSTPPAPGRAVKVGETIGMVEATYGIAPIEAPRNGRVVDTCHQQGAHVKKGDVVGWIE